MSVRNATHRLPLWRPQVLWLSRFHVEPPKQIPSSVDAPSFPALPPPPRAPCPQELLHLLNVDPNNTKGYVPGLNLAGEDSTRDGGGSGGGHGDSSAGVAVGPMPERLARRLREAQVNVGSPHRRGPLPLVVHCLCVMLVFREEIL